MSFSLELTEINNIKGIKLANDTILLLTFLITYILFFHRYYGQDHHKITIKLQLENESVKHEREFEAKADRILS